MNYYLIYAGMIINISQNLLLGIFLLIIELVGLVE